MTDDKEGPGSVFQKEIADVGVLRQTSYSTAQAEVLITTPFHPGYLTADLIDKAKNLKLCVTAGVGSE